jgi:transposase
MPKVTVVVVTAEQRTALEKDTKYGLTPSFRLRCQAVLLKTNKRSSLDVANELHCCEMAVNNWVKRYQEQGLTGLQIKPGRGRKPILKKETDLDAVRLAVQNSRQRISLAKAELEQELGKEFSQLTLKRFLTPIKP